MDRAFPVTSYDFLKAGIGLKEKIMFIANYTEDRVWLSKVSDDYVCIWSQLLPK